LAPSDDSADRTASASNERLEALPGSLEGHYVQNAGPVASTFLGAYQQFDGPFADRRNPSVQAAAMDTVVSYPDCASAWLVLASSDKADPLARLALVDRGLIALGSIKRDRRYDVVLPHLFLEDVRKDLLLLGIDACEALRDSRRAADLSIVLLRVTGWSDQALVKRALAFTALAGDDEAMAEIHRNRSRDENGPGPEATRSKGCPAADLGLEHPVQHDRRRFTLLRETTLHMIENEVGHRHFDLCRPHGEQPICGIDPGPACRELRIRQHGHDQSLLAVGVRNVECGLTASLEGPDRFACRHLCVSLRGMPVHTTSSN
jgi:hypothetical protein